MDIPTKPKPLFYGIFAISLILYICLGYFTERSHFWQVALLYGLLFIGYFYIISFNPSEKEVGEGILLSILLRVSLLFMLPNLSDDYFRFIWDGRLLTHHINPFSILPSAFIQTAQAAQSGLNPHLYHSLNSPNYYTIYPPVLQYVFGLSTKMSRTIAGSVFIMHASIILIEVGNFFIMKKILQDFNLPAKRVLIYALNPLVIMELTGNLHFEAFMIFFVLLSVFLLHRQKIILSALCFSVAVCCKLLPLLFLPLLIKRIGTMKSITFYIVCCVTTLLLFFPFILNQNILHLASSIDLYFQKFEFNASIFYLVKWIGFNLTGFDIIREAGFALSFCVFAVVIIISYYQKRDFLSIFASMLLCITAYLMFSTTVHPWYVTSLVALTVFTNWRYPVIWSCFIILSYYTYRIVPYSESYALVVVEYLAVLVFALYEMKKLKGKNLLFVSR